MNSKLISIPAHSPAIKDAGLTIDAAEGQSILGIVNLEKATAMLAKLDKSAGVQILSPPTCTTRRG